QDVVRLNTDGTVAETIVNIPHVVGIVADPQSGRLFVSGGGGAYYRDTIYIVDPVAHTATPLVTGLSDPDGLTLSPDGRTVYTALPDNQQVAGFDTETGQRVFTSGTIPALDGLALGFGTLAGSLFVNTNDGKIWQVNLNDPANPMLIASGGSRGDFVSVDPN